jgi:N-acetylmuramoyl-L-alanine amidase
MIKLTRLNEELKNLANRLPVEELDKVGNSAVQKLQAANGTSLGSSINEVKSGFSTITQEVDYPKVQPSFEKATPETSKESAQGLRKFTGTLKSGEVIRNIDGVSYVVPKAEENEDDVDPTTGRIEDLPPDIQATLRDIESVLKPAVQTAAEAAEDLGQTLKPVVGILTEKAGQLKTYLVKDVSAVKSDLETLTGSTVNNGFLEAVVGAVHPEAMKAAFEEVIESPPIQAIVRTVEEVVVPEFKELVNDAVQEDIPKTVSSIKSFLNNLVQGTTDIGLPGHLQNITEKASGSIQAVIKNIATNPINIGQLKGIMGQVANQDFSLAVSELQKFSDKAAIDIEKAVKGVNPKLFASIERDTETNALQPSFQLGSNSFFWNGKDTSILAFSYITSSQELESELRNITRPVTELVVHWTETFTNKDIGAYEIHQSQNQLGLNGIGYHYVIRRDGSIQRGRPVELIGDHVGNNHNIYSISIVLVGGINAPSGTENPTRFLDAKSLTRAQYTSFDKFLEKFYLAYPGGQVLGNNDIEPDQVDPGFNVPDYVRTHFDKYNVFLDPVTERSFSPEEIVDKRIIE